MEAPGRLRPGEGSEGQMWEQLGASQPDPEFRRVNHGPFARGGTACQHSWAQVVPVNLNESPEKGQLRAPRQ